MTPETVGSVTASTRSAPASEAITGQPMPGEPSTMTRGRPAPPPRPGLVAHQRHELAGVVFGDAETRVDQRSEARLGDHPGAVHDGLHADGVGGAHPTAELAALAGDGVDGVAVVGGAEHGREAADLGAASAGGAGLGIDDRLTAAAELVLSAELGAEHQVQVGGVDVAVGEHGAAGQRRERGHDARLAGAALAADHDQLTGRRHDATSRLCAAAPMRSHAALSVCSRPSTASSSSSPRA